jgi:hypothetical protein
MALYNQKFINKFSFTQLSLFNENTSLKEHFISPSNSLLAYLPSTQPLSAFVNNDNLSFKNHDFSPNTRSSESLSPEVVNNRGTSFKTLNLKSGGQSITTQEKSLRELTKSNPTLPFQNTEFAAKKTLFQDSNNLPFQSQNLFTIATLG